MRRVVQTACNALELSVTNSEEKSAIKNEIENPVKEQVLHRKSERRRVARDIFLVFEEQRSNRRCRGASNKKQSRPKSKFGHLKVEDPNKNKTLLRDIKNEPTCYLDIAKNPKKHKSKIQIQVNDTVNSIEASKSEDNERIPKPLEATSANARVNPIFLWVKQDDTRIVEVRCEDYDKRNRIRITKTTSGWRAIPRTDPSSSRIVKFFQKPLLKVKREVYINQVQNSCVSNDINCQSSEQNLNAFSSNNIDSVQILPTRENNIGDKPIVTEKIVRKEKKKRIKKEHAVKSKVENPHTTSENIQNIYETCNELDHLKNDNQFNVLSCTLKENEINQEPVDIENELNSNNIEEIGESDGGYTYQSPKSQIFELQLCPKTGLFLPSHDNDVDSTEFSDASAIARDIFLNIDSDANYQKSAELKLNNLDTETKNLKDLLDEADLLQHCEDNANSDADLIESLVKRCENNLIQENDFIKGSLDLDESFRNINNTDLSSKDMVTDVIQMTESISEQPKCFSFNEAGEIEGLHEELFPSNNYGDSLDKESVEISLNTKSNLNQDLITLNSTPDLTEVIADVIEDTPKDLSYKKREEICPQSESRSQCAVTSSSDVVKSPIQEGIPAIESTSETIKNLILEQFIKINTFNAASSSTAKLQQSEPINLGDNREATSATDSTNKYSDTSSYIETVVIDDNSDDEPMKKRIRNNTMNKRVNFDINQTSIIDKDPDPLTQLQLLIKNTQWKVPDPILVPKDRLGAVLASPAREIPLLITTRPELRLPEAFAHPEIIQNPHILVISMAQLEAILKNDFDAEKNKTLKASEINKSKSFSNECEKTSTHGQNISLYNASENSLPDILESNLKLPRVESSLASDINAATLAVLNQMIWLPYFGQLSQEFFKSLKDPNNSQNKFTSTILQFYNSQYGLQQLDGMYKKYIQHMHQLRDCNIESNQEQTQSYQNEIGSLQTSLEFAVFRKIIEHQMNNFLNFTQLATNTNTNQSESSTVKCSTNDNDNNASLHANIESLNCTKLNQTQDTRSNFLSTEVQSGTTNVDIDKSQFPTNHSKSRVGNVIENVDFTQFPLDERLNSENKPRLTCKSLSNLLQPENVTSKTVQNMLENATSKNFMKSYEVESKQNNIITKGTSTGPRCLQSIESNGTFKNVKPVKSSIDGSVQKRRNLNLAESGVSKACIQRIDPSESNTALWHPLFGSNTKPGYSSPWHWTTVTATGE